MSCMTRKRGTLEVTTIAIVTLLLLATFSPTPSLAGSSQKVSKKVNQPKKCPYQDEEHSHKPYPPLSACGWYNDNSCCEKEHTDQLIKKIYEARKGFQGSDECFEKLVVLHCGLLCSPYQRHFLSNTSDRVPVDLPASNTKKQAPSEDTEAFAEDSEGEEEEEDKEEKEEEEEEKEEGNLKSEVVVIRAARLRPKFRYSVCASHCEELFEICGESTIGFARDKPSWKTGANWVSAEEFCQAQSLLSDVEFVVVKENFYTARNKNNVNDERKGYLGDVTHIHNCFDGRATEAVAANSFMYGPGIKGGMIGQKTFSIQAVDVFGDDLRDGHDHFKVLVIKDDNEETLASTDQDEEDDAPISAKNIIESEVTDHNNGIYTVDYEISEPGSYQIFVSLNGKHISNSPITLHFEGMTEHICTFRGANMIAARPETPLETCTWYRDNACCTIKEDRKLNAWLTKGVAPAFRSTPACTNFFESLYCGFECSPHQDQFISSKSKDGVFEFSVCSAFCKQFYDTCKDAVIMGLTLKAVYSRHQDFCMANAPYPYVGILVKDDKCFNGTNNEVSAKHSYAFGPHFNKPATAGKETYFKIKAMDMYGGEVNKGGDKFEVAFHGPYTDCSPVIDHNDGTYTTYYRAAKAGTYSVYVTYEHVDIAGSPFLLQVMPGDVDPTACIATGYGLHLAIAGLPAYFYVHTSDEFRNPVPGGATRVTAQLSGPAHVVADVVEVSEGKYRVSYRTHVSGRYVLRVMVDGFHVPQSPFVVHVEPEEKTEAAKCVALGGGSRKGQTGRTNSFEIIAKDFYGNNRDQGGDVFEVSLEGPTGQWYWAEVEDNNDGTYLVSYRISGRGVYQLSITLVDPRAANDSLRPKEDVRGDHILDSPRELWID